MGNTAFLGIPGKPVLYTAAAGAKSVIFSTYLLPHLQAPRLLRLTHLLLLTLNQPIIA